MIKKDKEGNFVIKRDLEINLSMVYVSINKFRSSKPNYASFYLTRIDEGFLLYRYTYKVNRLNQATQNFIIGYT